MPCKNYLLMTSSTAIIFILFSFLFYDVRESFANELTGTLRSAREPVFIDGKTIEGDLDLSGADIPVAVSLTNCTFKSAVNISMAQVAGSLNLSGSTFEKGLSLKGARIGHHLILDGCVFKSQASPALDTCRIEVKGDLHLNDTQFYAPWQGEGMQIQGSILAEGLIMEGNSPPAARLNGARVGGGIFINNGNLGEIRLQTSRIGLGFDVLNSQFAGEAIFCDAQIGGSAAFEGVSFKDKVAFDRAEVKGGLFFQPDAQGNPCSIGGEARFHGVQIGGQAHFKGVSFKNGVTFNGAEVKSDLFFLPDEKGNPWTVEGEARFIGAKIGGEANFKGVSFKNGVTFGGAEVKGRLVFQPDEKGNPCTIEGEARFIGAKIGGQAHFEGVSFKKRVFFHGARVDGEVGFKGVSFKEVAFDRAEVKRGLFFQPDAQGNPCSIGGEARFIGAKIGDEANFRGVSFKNGVTFDGAEVKGSLFFQPDARGNPCSIGGEARFHGVQIGGQANFEGVSFKEVAFDGAEVKGDLFFLPDEKGNPCSIGGEARFHGAHVDGDVNIIRAKIPKFIAEGVHFGKALRIRDGTEIKDLVLKDAEVDVLNIDWKSISGGLELMGCEYGSVEDKEGLLEVLLSREVRERQPYEFLENHYKGIGEVDFANKVYYERCVLVSPSWKDILEPPYWKNILSFIPSIIWDRLLRYGAGYGVRPLRMICWLLGFFIFGVLLFKCPLMIKPMETSQGTSSNMPSWHEALWLSFVNLLPGIPGEYPKAVNRWQLTLVGTYIATIIRFFGWIVVSVGGLAATGIFRRYEW